MSDEALVSAAALVAVHVMAEASWTKHLPKLPRSRPELRLVLIYAHRAALLGDVRNLSELSKDIQTAFAFDNKTALDRIEDLVEIGYLVRKVGKKTGEVHVYPSLRAKEALQRIGRDYLHGLRVANFTLQGRPWPPIWKETPPWVDEMIDMVRNIKDYPSYVGSDEAALRSNRGRGEGEAQPEGDAAPPGQSANGLPGEVVDRSGPLGPAD